MKRILFAALLMAAPFTQAQVFLDPNIIRQAGEAAATGNIRLGNIEMDNVQMNQMNQAQQPMPSAREIAAEIRAQEQQERYRREQAEREAQRQRVAGAIERAYKAEYRR